MNKKEGPVTLQVTYSSTPPPTCSTTINVQILSPTTVD